MKTNQINLGHQKSILLTNLFICLFFFSASSLLAQSKSQIIGIRSNNVNKTTVKLTTNGEAITATIGSSLISGSKLLIPSNTTVILQSPKGKQVCSASAKPMEYIVDFKGSVEKHTVKGKGSSLQSTVNRGVGPDYRVSNGRGKTVASKTTQFTFTDQSEGNNKAADVLTTEGSVNIINQVPIYVGEVPIKTKRGAALTKSISVTQSEGQDVYYARDIPVNFDNYQDAISDIREDISLRADPDDQANNLLCLGELYLDINQPQQAIRPFREAVEIYEYYYGDDDMNTLEARLSLAEALVAARVSGTEANDILSDVETILLTFLRWDEQDLKEAYDREERELICEDIVELCDFLGWLYDIAGYDEERDKYDQRAKAGC